eukprot:TRINITY_DN4383_c0_g1_i1.p2 TRINITY_DN4383_c0_g1~~TRINITY_DN4383_c0_g1_i1.p2  ORF type:complete len:68 (-),score=5.26 TRINITY_DN4383_c0_g1_i1:62-265(-)
MTAGGGLYGGQCYCPESGEIWEVGSLSADSCDMMWNEEEGTRKIRLACHGGTLLNCKRSRENGVGNR